MSATIDWKSAVASGWKTMAALPADASPISVSMVTCAVLMAKRRSGAGWESLRLPRRTSSRPMCPRRLRRALQLRLEALQRGQPLLHRRVRGEEVAERLPGAGREDVEGRQLALGPQVALRDAVHAARDLHEGAGERARPPGD